MFARERSIKRKRRLQLEPLEARHLLANLQINGLQLVTAQNTPITASDLAIGEKIFARATWDQTDMVGGEQYYVRFMADGVPIHSNMITAVTGNSFGHYWWLGGWYASPGTHTVTATIDGAFAVSETNEGDNSLSFNVTPTSQSPPQKISNPLDGDWYQHFGTGNYHDVDSTSGIDDFGGNGASYNGHDAYDVGTHQIAEMDSGVTIRAAADGVVVAAHDGEFDRQSAWLDPPPTANYVIVDHGDGWQTFYWHMRRDSVRVNVGDTVTRGQLLGYMGSSGISSGPHVHFGLTHNGASVETFYQPEDYWVDAPGYVFDDAYLAQTVVTNYLPNDDFWEGPSEYRNYDQSSGQISLAGGYYSGLQAGDVLNFRWYRPNGSLFVDGVSNINQDYRTSGWWYYVNLPSTPDLGTWKIEYLINGVLQKTETFTVSNTSSPEILVKDGTKTVGDGRYTPFDLGPIAEDASDPVKSFTIRNHGTGTLNLSDLDVPTGFYIVDDIVSSLAAGQQDTITIGLDTANAGYFAGQVEIVSNDADESLYNFSIEGLVQPVSGAALSVGIADRQLLEGQSSVGKVRRTGSTAGALTVNLAALSSSDLTVPASVVIPDGQSEVLFTITAKTDALAESLETVGIQATAVGYAAGQNELYVENFSAPNSSPTINATNVSLGSIPEDSVAASLNGTPISALIPAISDPDAGAQKSIAVVGLTEKTRGTWQFSVNGGASWTPLGNPSDAAARLLTSSHRVRFVPNANYNGTPQLQFRAWDQTDGAIAGSVVSTIGKQGGTGAYSTATKGARVTVTAVNDAPVLNASTSASLGSLAEDTPAASNTGVLVSSFIAGISDMDPGAVKGIAVINLTEKTKGTWQFSTNGGTTWTALGSPSDSAARLLLPTNRVRFLPSQNYNGTPQLIFRAWDRSDGKAAGSTASTVGKQGGTGAYSTASKSVKLTVTPLNDKPVLTLSGTVGYVRNAPPVVLAPSATVTDVDSANFGGGELRVRITVSGAANRLALGAGVTVDGANKVFVDGVHIGTRTSSGIGTNELRVQFNANATKARAQKLVRSVTYQNLNGSGGQRTIVFTVSDGDGGLSDERTKKVNVT